MEEIDPARRRGSDAGVMLTSALAGALIISIFHEGRFRFFWDMEASDWTATVLACAALILTAVGIFVAILALWGWKTIKRDSITAARKEAKRCVYAYLASPEAEGKINLAVEQWFNRNAEQGTLLPYITDLVRQSRDMTEFDAEVDDDWGDEGGPQNA